MVSVTKPNTRKMTIIAQDPDLRVGEKILTTEVEIPAEELSRGPRGYRVHVVDYDTTTGTLYMPRKYESQRGEVYPDPYKEIIARDGVASLLQDPQFHQQNVYAIVMRILTRFEFALGRRIPWGFDGHQLYVAPHAFADPNAFYSEHDQSLMFGYFQAPESGERIFSCLSHDVVAHETTHALLDGLRRRYTDPSSPEQAGFHEGFADIVALLSVFSLPEVVSYLLGVKKEETVPAPLINVDDLTKEKLQAAFCDVAEQMGRGLSGIRGNRKGALRNSLDIPPLKSDEPLNKYLTQEDFQEPHRRGELLVAAMMTTFLEIWVRRIEQLKAGGRQELDRQLVVTAGAHTADHLLTMAIRAIDYAPPTDIQFCDFLSALLTADCETVPDDSQYHYRKTLLASFRRYGITPSSKAGEDGTWPTLDDSHLIYERTHLQSLMNEPDEVFHFLWENRYVLDLTRNARTTVQSVRPCLRVGPDGFFLRETVADYVQRMTLRAEELESLTINIPDGMPPRQEVTLYGGGVLIFNEFGRLKYHICNHLLDDTHQTPRLKYLWEYGYFDEQRYAENMFARMHLQRSLSLSVRNDEEF